MLTSQTLERIEALGLDFLTETAIREIVEDAVRDARFGPEVKFLQVPGDWPSDYQAQFWARYPNKKAKGAALRALEKIARGGKTKWSELIAGVERYISSDEVRRGFVKHPATWLNGQCWCDEAGPKPKNDRPLSFFEIAAGHR